MKKVLICFILAMCIFSVFAINMVYAVSENKTNNVTVVNEETTNQIVKLKDKLKQEKEDYVERYGSETYGMTAYVLAKVRVFSIPFCFLGIAIGAICQYVIGIRKLDVRDRGFAAIITFVTIGVICQVLPLIFAIVVKGWRS